MPEEAAAKENNEIQQNNLRSKKKKKKNFSSFFPVFWEYESLSLDVSNPALSSLSVVFYKSTTYAPPGMFEWHGRREAHLWKTVGGMTTKLSNGSSLTFI